MRNVILALLLTLFTHTLYAQHISYQHFTLVDGLPGLQITTLHQAHDGRIWIGTKSGLSVFDGKHFVNYSEKDGLPNGRITHIQSKGEAIWFTTAGALMSYRNGKFAEHDTPNSGIDSLQRKRVRIVQTLFKNDELLIKMEWFNDKAIGRGNSHYALNTKTASFREIPILKNTFVSALNSNQLFYHSYFLLDTISIGTFQIKSELISPLKSPVKWKDDGLYRFSPVPSKDIKNTLISLLDGGKEEVIHKLYVVEADSLRLIQGKMVYIPSWFTRQFQTDEQTLIWTEPEQPYLFQYNIKTAEKKAWDFPTVNPICWIQDQLGNLWLGTENGLYKIPKNPLFYFDDTHGLADNSVWGFQNLNNQWWVAVYLQGLMYSEKKGVTTQFKIYPPEKFPKKWDYNNMFYYGLRKTSDGKLTIPHNAALYYDGKEIQLVDSTYTIGKPYLGSYIDEERREIAMVGLRGIDFIDFEGSLIQNIPTQRFNGNVFDIERIDEENYVVALGRNQALFNRKTNEVKSLNLTNPTNVNDTLNIGFMTLAKDSKGNIWCGSLVGENGLYLYKNGTFQKIAAHVIDGIIETVAVVNNGRILLASSTNDGLLAIHLERFYQYQAAEDKSKVPNPFYWFDESNGFEFKQEPQQNSLVADGENRVMFTTGEAKAYYFDIDTTIFDLPQLSPYIYSVEGFNSDSLTWTPKEASFQTNDTLSFTTEERAFRFEPHCITHNAPEQLRYAYRLKQGGEWTNWKTAEETKLLVTNLQAGYNQLEVKGFYKFQTPEMQANANRFVVYIQPYWYETLFGKLAMGGLVLFTFVGIYFLSDRRRKRKEQERQTVENLRLKAERLEEIEEQLSTVQQEEEERLQLQEEFNQYNEELQASAEQVHDWITAVKEGKTPKISTDELNKYQSLPFYDQLMAIVKMAGKLTEQLAKQAQKDKLRREELEQAQIRLVKEEGVSKFKQIFTEQHPGILPRLHKQFPDLTQRETELIMLIRLGKNNAEVAESMGIKYDSVRTNRKRLKKKLDLPTAVDLTEWVKTF